jgi:hypothetical protein
VGAGDRWGLLLLGLWFKASEPNVNAFVQEPGLARWIFLSSPYGLCSAMSRLSLAIRRGRVALSGRFLRLLVFACPFCGGIDARSLCLVRSILSSCAGCAGRCAVVSERARALVETGELMPLSHRRSSRAGKSSNVDSRTSDRPSGLGDSPGSDTRLRRVPPSGKGRSRPALSSEELAMVGHALEDKPLGRSRYELALLEFC